MSKARSLAASFTLIAGLVIPLANTSLAADTAPPKMTAGQMVDGNANGKADMLQLTFSENVKHPADSDGSYPFSVDGYKVKKVGAATRATLSLNLKEKGSPDLAAKPNVTYKRTTQDPVKDAAGNQAKNQTFSKTSALDIDGDGIVNTADQCVNDPEDSDGFHDTDGCPDLDNDGDSINDVDELCDDAAEDVDGFEDADGCPDPDNDGDTIIDTADDCDNEAEDADGFQDVDGCPDPDNDGDGVLDGVDPGPNNPCIPNDPQGNCDPDNDGYTTNTGDCAANDADIHPGALDNPDLLFLDKDCDGIDGTANDAIFVSTAGADNNPGTMAAPMKTINAAITAASNANKDVYAATGNYSETLQLVTGVSIFGAYDANGGWSRSSNFDSVVTGTPEGAVANGDTNVLLQFLTVKGQAPNTAGSTAYGLRAVASSDITLQKTEVMGGNGVDGATGLNPGAQGFTAGGFSGGSGGGGGYGASGGPGGLGFGPLPGGVGGAGSYNGNGGPGGQGGPGANGTAGGAGQLVLTSMGAQWSNTAGDGGTGGNGGPGSGGGGGGGGGGYIVSTPYQCNCDFWGSCDTCYYYTYYYGGNGGPGGTGGGGGTGGNGGKAGGASFGVYAHNSTITVIECDISSGNGGKGGTGRSGGGGGSPSGPNGGQVTSQGDGGAGGVGGFGGAGGGGGGGAGGPSIALFLAGTSVYNNDNQTTLTAGSAGTGGSGGSSPGIGGSTGANGVTLPRYPVP